MVTEVKQNRLRYFFILLTILGLGERCGTSLQMSSSRLAGEIEPSEVITINSEVVDFCIDGTRLLFLENSGARIIAWDTSFENAETIPISTRILPARGIYADRYYIYVYDQRTLFRIPKDNFLLSAWLNNVRVVGITAYAPAELLISDGERQRIWLKTMFGESRVFLDNSEVVRPGALTVFSDGVYGVISDGQRLLNVNRAGIVLRSITMPQPVDLLASDEKGRAFLMRKGQAILWLVSEHSLSGFVLNGVNNPIALHCYKRHIYILDNGRRILIYPVPGE